MKKDETKDKKTNDEKPKGIIRGFNPVIYPFHLYIIIGDKKLFFDNFAPCNGVETPLDLDTPFCCTIKNCYHIESQCKSVVIYAPFKLNLRHPGSITHEAFHAVDHVLEMISERQPSSEQKAYIGEFIAKACIATLTGKEITDFD